MKLSESSVNCVAVALDSRSAKWPQNVLPSRLLLNSVKQVSGSNYTDNIFENDKNNVLDGAEDYLLGGDGEDMYVVKKSEGCDIVDNFADDNSQKCLRSDNGTEFMNGDFQDLLRKRAIKHETSCPNSPHQNGTSERYWRTLFEMARCLLLESGVPKML
ncbi:retrovirus-related pol poly from transposon tnt 1-94 [Paramuricea clavata]|uniref:Retrovirus-related pol poly from transposon tnt 1-94 n=1 Tax=Paramuricea clavata TaxID=317549 RepID=A0A6S7G131_PARCT|nr:retrovirus-related pol poly from transposon tnt 1-94 [Paramuricea clavata]